MVSAVRHRSCGALLDLDEVKDALGLVQQSPLGLQPIPVNHIVGTVGRRGDFDRCFHPLRPDLRDRMARVHEAFPDGALPSIDVFQIDDAYFVSDGHHRVALARRCGIEFIDAMVTEIHGPYRLGPDVDPAQIEATAHERRFLEESGLALVRPDARFVLSQPVGYADMAAAIKAHGYDLMQREESWLSPHRVAAHWHDCVYQPTLDHAASSGLDALLPACADADMFLFLHRSHRSAFSSDCAEAEAAIEQAVIEESRPPTGLRALVRRLLPHRDRGATTRPLPRRSDDQD